MELLPGDLIFAKGTGWESYAIEKFMHSPYSHVAGVVNENQVIEAMNFKKTGYQSIAYYSGFSDVYRCDLLTATQRQQIVKYAQVNVGSRYDYLLIVWEVVRYLLHKAIPYFKTKRVICSTLWADAYLAAGLNLCPDVKYPTPGDLANSKLLRKIGSI
ncbi:hypothetical protein PP175_05685 [Aneurinibacillus sp. Ricciae_BoGa-3]|uniref:hypothetical protein n=1 Tax=Aneurinibacillus sp. Ricciae_BoGa-3 TaxID=3022697 RepID=UPI00233F97E2|nr:hypothetical protein [Aneurinibacillus sp. Ricciae_BoGa-3]WCK55442.1 hypothetical protein PP175_05685 [Aneurinibacillus sp. Ricciae_BoGa-3]